MRTLLTGWFTFHHGEATAGDLLAAETVRAWLTDAGIDHDIPRSGGVSIVDGTTRVDPEGIVGRRSQAVESALCRADAVITTRLHGLVLALRHGVPAVAVDPVGGGAKVTRQAMALGWPAVIGVDELDDAVLRRHLQWALTEEARAAARSCVEGATRRSADLQADVIAAVRGGSGR